MSVKTLLPLLPCVFLALCSGVRAADSPKTPFTLYDMHIHLRGGMTTEKAIERQQATGIRSGVLENHGRAWPINDNEALKKHLDEVDKLRGRKHTHYQRVPGRPGKRQLVSIYPQRYVFVGIQVNDRDWYKTIDPELHKRLDFVLADTMIMGTNRDGKPCKLWMEDTYDIDDVDAWMERYVEHNLQVLNEPITILANPTYLPSRIADQYDRLWTEQRMDKIIDTAIKNKVALEIQAESPFPKMSFLKRAKAKGAKFSFGTNNHDDRVHDMSRWHEAIEELQLTERNIFVPR